jgi:hypothetical protein
VDEDVAVGAEPNEGASYEYDDGGEDAFVEDEQGGDGNVYCICQRADYGEMIACDNQRCPVRGCAAVSVVVIVGVGVVVVVVVSSSSSSSSLLSSSWLSPCGYRRRGCRRHRHPLLSLSLSLSSSSSWLWHRGDAVPCRGLLLTQIEWFHLNCVGLTPATRPGENESWCVLALPH